MMNQIRSANESMDTQNLGLAQQLKTSKFKLSREQTEVSHLRSSVERNRPIETRDAEDLQILREEHLPLARDNLRHSAEMVSQPQWFPFVRQTHRHHGTFTASRGGIAENN